VMFEPDSKASDSLSYDLTAWAVPYSYNLKAYATTEQIKPDDGSVAFELIKNSLAVGKPYGYIVNFTGFNELKFMAALYRKEIKIRYTLKPTEIEGGKFERGSIIIARGDNLQSGDKFDQIVTDAANSCQVKLVAATSGLSETGRDFGSDFSPARKKPVVGILCGSEIQSSEVGEFWYLFERELNYPITLIGTSYAERTDLSKYDVLILPGGNYSKQYDTILYYVRKGAKVIALESAGSIFSRDKSTALNKAVELRNAETKAAEKKDRSDDPKLLKKYEYEVERRYGLSERSAGSIYKVHLDETNPYVFGLGNEWFIMKRSTGYPFLVSGLNIGYILDKDPVSGFAGNKFREKIKSTIVIGSEKIGAGEVIYITDDPYFRAFWKSGRVLLGNIILR